MTRHSLDRLRVFHTIVALFAATLVPRTAGADDGVNIIGPHYRFQAVVNKNADLCVHMEEVLNRNFKTMWATEMQNPERDFHLGAGVPKLPGVVQDANMAYAMRYSLAPSSEEFKAIPWNEGRAIFGDPPETAGPVSTVPMPVLVAHFDFDNDGTTDTVMKLGFTRGIDYMWNERSVGWNEEYLYVWRSKLIQFHSPQSLWELMAGAKPEARPMEEVNGDYLRPFRFKGHTYVAEYHIGSPKHQGKQLRMRESMSVSSYRPADQSVSATASTQWKESKVCEYSMIQQPATE
jgi:hypothetical protein